MNEPLWKPVLQPQLHLQMQPYDRLSAKTIQVSNVWILDSQLRYEIMNAYYCVPFWGDPSEADDQYSEWPIAPESAD